MIPARPGNVDRKTSRQTAALIIRDGWIAEIDGGPFFRGENSRSHLFRHQSHYVQSPSARIAFDNAQLLIQGWTKRLFHRLCEFELTQLHLLQAGKSNFSPT